MILAAHRRRIYVKAQFKQKLFNISQLSRIP